MTDDQGADAVSWPSLRQALQLLSRGFQPPDPLAQLRAQLLAVELQSALHKGTLPFAVADWKDAIPTDRRNDFIVIGRRGGGKTACACAIAQAYGAGGRPTYAVDWPDEARTRMGFRAARSPGRARKGPAGSAPVWTELQDALVLLDEATLRQATGAKDDDLYRALALARHNDLCLVWTSQSSSGLHRDALRMEATLVCKAIDPLAARFEREELLDLATGAVAIQARLQFEKNPAACLILSGSLWVATQNPLPAGWTDAVSRLWR